VRGIRRFLSKILEVFVDKKRNINSGCMSGLVGNTASWVRPGFASQLRHSK
jgi:hypothetical protein